MGILYETRWSGIHAWHREKAGTMCAHVHDYVEIMYIKSGEMRHYINFQAYDLCPGDVIFVFPGQIHSHETTAGENFVLLFPKDIPVFDAVFCNALPVSPVLRQAVDAEADCLFLAAARANSADVPFQKGMALGYISLILGRLLPLLALTPVDAKNMTTEQRLIRYCSAHYREPITLTSVADALGYSAAHLSHLFTDKFKIGFSQFVSTMRVEDAKKMLRGDTAITQIAFDCGFGSMRSFNRVFKVYTGSTPSAYRALHQR